MAQQPENTETAPAPKSKKKLILIVTAVLVVLLAGGGAAAYFMLHGKEDPHAAKHGKGQEEAEAAAAEEEGHADPKTALTFVPFETFTVNLLPDPDEKFLQLDLTMEVKGSELAEKLKTQMPALRNRVLLLLTSKKASDIATPEGKTQLSEELLAELSKPLTKGGQPLKVTQVLFTSFVIQ